MIDEPEIFKVAAELPAGERSAYLDAECAGRPEVRAGVEELLRSPDVSGFMEAQPAESLSPAIEAELARLKPVEARAALAEADALAVAWPNVDEIDPRVDFGTGRPSILVGPLLLREAHALLEK